MIRSAGWTKNPVSDAVGQHRQQDTEYPIKQAASDWLDNETFDSYYPNSGSRLTGNSSKAAPGKLNLSQFDNITDAVGRLSFNQKKPVKSAPSHVSHGNSDPHPLPSAAADASTDHMFKVMAGTLFNY